MKSLAKSGRALLHAEATLPCAADTHRDPVTHEETISHQVTPSSHALTSQASARTLRLVLSQTFSGGARGAFFRNSPCEPPINLPCVVRVEGGKSEPVIKTTQRARVGVFRSCLHWKTEPRPRFLARNLWGNGASAVTAKVGQSSRKRFSRICGWSACLFLGEIGPFRGPCLKSRCCASHDSGQGRLAKRGSVAK